MLIDCCPFDDDDSEEEIDEEGCEDQDEDWEVAGFSIHYARQERRDKETARHAAEDETHPRLTSILYLMECLVLTNHDPTSS